MEGKKYKNKREFLRDFSSRAGKAVFNYGKNATKPVDREVVSIGVLSGIGTYAFSYMPDFLRAIKEGTYHARHAYRTTKEMREGSEGMKAVDNLEDALKVIAKASAENELAREELDSYFNERLELVDRLANNYHENETLAREADRLATQIKGMLVEYTAAGDEVANKVTGGLFKKIDNFIMNRVGDANKAREGLPQLQEFYREARKFYDGREKHENTVKELCDYLSKKSAEGLDANKRLNEHLELMIKQLDKTYNVEDHVFDIDDKVSFYKALIERKKEQLTAEDVKDIGEEVSEYRDGVNKAEAGVMQDVPMQHFNERNWVDSVVNPLSIGIAGAVLLKGISKFVMPKRAYDSFTSLTLMPITFPYSCAKMLVKKYKQSRTDKLKKPEGLEEK